MGVEDLHRLVQANPPPPATLYNDPYMCLLLSGRGGSALTHLCGPSSFSYVFSLMRSPTYVDGRGGSVLVIIHADSPPPSMLKYCDILVIRTDKIMFINTYLGRLVSGDHCLEVSCALIIDYLYTRPSSWMEVEDPHRLVQANPPPPAMHHKWSLDVYTPVRTWRVCVDSSLRTILLQLCLF